MWKVFLWFETIFAQLDETELKTEESRGKDNQPYTAKTHNHIPTSFALAACYSKEFLSKENEYFSYRGEDCTDVFAEEMEKYLSDFADFS